jgi:hypothetical protein
VTRGGAFALLTALMVMDIGQSMLAQSLGRNQDFAAELFAVVRLQSRNSAKSPLGIRGPLSRVIGSFLSARRTIPGQAVIRLQRDG